MSVPDFYLDFGRRYAEAWSSQLPENVARMFSLDGFITINGSEPAIGRASVADIALDYMTSFPDLDVQCDQVLMENGAIQWHWTMRGTHSGPDGSGRRIDISGYETIVLDREGLIVSAHGYFDENDYTSQLSLVG